MNVLIVYGSLAEKSINKALARAAQRLAPEGMSVELAGVAGFPEFNRDIELTQYPAVAQTLKDKINAADGILFVTPEYNRSMPGVLKNAIDWVSRPSKAGAKWGGKPVGVISASDGVRGASFAQYDLKRILSYFGAHLMGQPEFFGGEFDKKLDADQNLSDEKTTEMLKRYLVAFKAHVEKFKSAA